MLSEFQKNIKVQLNAQFIRTNFGFYHNTFIWRYKIFKFSEVLAGLFCPKIYFRIFLRSMYKGINYIESYALDEYIRFDLGLDFGLSGHDLKLMMIQKQCISSLELESVYIHIYMYIYITRYRMD